MKEIFLIGNQDTENDAYDKNLVRSLASFYGNAIQGDTFEFEHCLTDYFKTNFKEITHNANSNFFFKFSDISDENADNLKEGDLFKIAKQFGIDASNFENHFGANIVVKDELVYEENENGLNVIYASNKAINNIIEDLHGASLYYKDLAKQNLLSSNNNAKLQNAFLDYAKCNGIELENTSTSAQNTLVQRKRFVKRKSKENKIIDFKQDLG